MKKKTPKLKTDVIIDYPTNNEEVRPGHYAIRCTAIGGDHVEVSLNSSDWIGTRTDAGFFWLDWTPTEKGKVKIVARIQTPDGKWKKSSVRTCNVSTN